METRKPLGFLLAGMIALALIAHAQDSSQSPPTGALKKTVRFDDASTAALVLQARGEGVQIYACVKDADWAWKLKGPDAILFDEKHQPIGTHFAGPTWRLKDGSELKGTVLTSKPQPGTIPWLILAAKSTGGEGRLSHVDVVRRSDTQGGLAPTSVCDAQYTGGDVRVPYSATYSFFDTTN